MTEFEIDFDHFDLDHFDHIEPARPLMRVSWLSLNRSLDRHNNVAKTWPLGEFSHDSALQRHTFHL